MEMNRYILAALYVMAGCAVTLPLKAQEGNGLLKGERCRPVIASTLKVVTACVEESKAECHFVARLSRNYFLQACKFSKQTTIFPVYFTCCKTIFLSRLTHKIRAPEK